MAKRAKAIVHKVGHAYRHELEIETHESSDYGLRHVTLRLGHHRIGTFKEILKLAADAVDCRTSYGQSITNVIRDIEDGILEAGKKAKEI